MIIYIYMYITAPLSDTTVYFHVSFIFMSVYNRIKFTSYVNAENGGKRTVCIYTYIYIVLVKSHIYIFLKSILICVLFKIFPM
jgi:hypothetical protein